MFTLQDPIAFSHRNDPLHKLRWFRNGSTGQVPLLELKTFSRYDQGLFHFQCAFRGMIVCGKTAGKYKCVSLCFITRYYVPEMTSIKLKLVVWKCIVKKGEFTDVETRWRSHHSYGLMRCLRGHDAAEALHASDSQED